MKNCVIILCGVFLLQNCLGLEYNRGQRFNYNANTDFLLHEGGAPTSGNQSPTNQNGGKSNYAAQFPALGPPSSSQSQTIASSNMNAGRQTNAQSSSGKRDYVAPQYPTIKPTQQITQASGGNSPTPNAWQMPSNNQNGGRPNYAAQFPSLGPSSTSQTSNNQNVGPQRNTQSSNGKRDYVAPQYPTVKPTQQVTQAAGGNSPTPNAWQMPSNNQNGGRPNYAAQFPSLGPSSTSNNQNVGPQRNPQSSNGKRDYVAPQYTTVKPNQPNNQPTVSGGKVKDLINFYDSKNPSQGGTFSYSSILQGNNKNGPHPTPTVPSTPMSSSVQTPKPFSSVVAGNKPSTLSTFTTPTPTTRLPSTPMSRPGTPVLPSTIVNNNRGTTNTNSNGVTDAELEILSEELLRKDTNNAARYITINYQEKTTSQSTDDKAPLPLITVAPEVWNIPTIQKFVPLLDNYERDSLVNEHVTAQERTEENAFMDAVMSTSVMRHLMTFLKNKGFVTPDPRQQRDFLKQIWFSLYSRGKGKIGSSGFEHVFVSELKNGGVSGLHNWIYFSREELANRVNYLGYLKYELLNDKGAVMKIHFNQQGVDKPVNSLFVGTSPELEMALYTVCFVTRVDNDCKLKLANKDVNIITYNYRYRSKNLIGSAYPQI